MQTQEWFVYTWHIDEDDFMSSTIRMFGLNAENETVCVHIHDFEPSVFVELPTHIQWSPYKANLVAEPLKEWIGDAMREYKMVWQKRLYYAHVKDGKTETFPYLHIKCASMRAIKTLVYKSKQKPTLQVHGIGNISLQFHEQMATSILQMTCERNIPSAGWIRSTRCQPKSDTQTTCTHEWSCSYRSLMPCASEKQDQTVDPIVLSFDIECNSTVQSAMPNPQNPSDVVFQIGISVSRYASGTAKKILMTLGECDPIEGVQVLSYSCEKNLLRGFSEIVHHLDPQVITGYNIFSFDMPYMLKRAALHKLGDLYQRLGKMKFRKDPIVKVSWESKAYANQDFEYVDSHGRLWIDMLPVIKRDYKFASYKLGAVATHFLGATKDPLSAKDIFDCYLIGVQGGGVGKRAMGLVGTYCAKDADITLQILKHTMAWTSLSEMAKTCCVPMIYLYTKGEQIKAYSQIYKESKSRGYVVESNKIEVPDDFRYTGAYVVTPVPGLYKNVVPFDFTSLYPTTIIAYNIDYSTFVVDETIPDEQCHVFDWEEHSGCEHDPNVQKVEQFKQRIEALRKSRAQQTPEGKTQVDEQIHDLIEEKNDVHIPTHTVCQHFRYRFLREPVGILPTMLTHLLGERKRVRGMIAENFKQSKTASEEDRKRLLARNKVLDKRQLSYKISANSMYGCMGVKRGYLPLPPGACCTTARGRENIVKAQQELQKTYNATIVYGDTDSCYVQFDVDDRAQLWKHCEWIEKKMLADKIFPSPMKLAFEESVYPSFFIMSKKRYMALCCDASGTLKKDILKKGVLLARRDSCAFTKTFYRGVIDRIFDRVSFEDCVKYIEQVVADLFAGRIQSDQFVITKSIGTIESYKKRPIEEENAKKRAKQLADVQYTPSDGTPAGFVEQLRVVCPSEVQSIRAQFEKEGGDESKWVTFCIKAIKQKYTDKQRSLLELEEKIVYETRSLPPIVQLAERMRARGVNVSAGSRLEYLILSTHDGNEKQWNKVEEFGYFKRHLDTLQIDYLYYLKLTVNPIDELLQVAFSKKRVLQDMFQKESVQRSVQYARVALE